MKENINKIYLEMDRVTNVTKEIIIELYKSEGEKFRQGKSRRSYWIVVFFKYGFSVSQIKSLLKIKRYGVESEIRNYLQRTF